MHVACSLANGYLRLDGGDPRGGDPVHKTVSGWSGWRRIPVIGSARGMPASAYQARPWLAALQPLLASGWKVDWTTDARAWADEQVARGRRRDFTLAGKVALEEPERWQATAAGRRPMAHQVQLLRALTEMGGSAGVRDDMGLGKTTTALLHWAATGLARALVICPKSVKLNWQDEIAAVFAQREGEPLVYLIDGSTSHRASVFAWMRAAMVDKSHAIAIVNYDLLPAMGEIAWKTLEEWVGGQACIADEFHYCKDLHTKRAKACQALMALAQDRQGLTGTPVRNTVEDLYAQCEILRPGTWVSYHDFANRHLVITQAQFGSSKRKVDVVRGGKNLDELNRVVNTIWVGRKKDEVLTLPPMIRSKPQLELDGVHLQVYKAMKEKARVELQKLMETPMSDLKQKILGDTVIRHGSTEVTGEMIDNAFGHTGNVSIFHPLARSAVEAAMRCEMIAQGFISGLPEQYATEIAPMLVGKAEPIEGYPNAFVFPDSPKLQWICETIEKDLVGRQVVVFSRFNAPLHWLRGKLETQGGAGMLIGSMDAIARQTAIESFRKGQQRVLLVQVKLAEGFNLTCATDVLFLGRDWSPAINSQAEARCHRIGTAGTVNVQIPIVHNTVERFIDKRLIAKDADAQQALRSVTIADLLEAL